MLEVSVCRAISLDSWSRGIWLLTATVSEDTPEDNFADPDLVLLSAFLNFKENILMSIGKPF